MSGDSVSKFIADYFLYLVSPASIVSWEYWLFLSIHLIIMLILFVAMYEHMRHARLMADTPTSRIRSAAQGFVELKGMSKQLRDMQSPLSNSICVWWSYKIEKLQQSGKNRNWVTIEDGESHEAFVLHDGSGECVVHPEGAEIIPHQTRTWRGNTPRPSQAAVKKKFFARTEHYRYTEELLYSELQTYAIGMFHTINPTSLLPNTGDIIRQWKADYQALLEKYDTNGDGQLDEQEWQQVLNAAEEEVRRKTAETDMDENIKPIHILSVEGLPKRRSYIISGIDEEALQKQKRGTARWCSVFFFIFLAHNLYAIGQSIL